MDKDIGQTLQRVDRHRVSDDNDKTEQHRVRSLRAIISSTEKRRVLERDRPATTTEPTLLTSSEPSLNAVMDVSRVKKPQDEANSPTPSHSATETDSPGLVFSKLVPIRSSPMTIPTTIDLAAEPGFVTWLESFKKELKEITQGHDPTCNAYLQLLIDVHPEVCTLLRDRSTIVLSPRTSGRRMHARTPLEGSMGVWEAFHADMANWTQYLDAYMTHESTADHSRLWEKARLSLIYKMVSDILISLKTMTLIQPEGNESLDSFTSGVSYVKSSESHQHDVSSIYAPLPPVIIQPPIPKRIRSAQITAMVHTITTQNVLLVRIPDRDDAIIKNYLLHAANRRSLVKSFGATACRMIGGLQDICQIMGDHIFLSCHYFLDGEKGTLTPCIDSTKGSSSALEESNLQIAVVVRKGIGGTWALRNAARVLDAAQILPLLTGKKAIREMDFANGCSSVGCAEDAVRRKLQKCHSVGGYMDDKSSVKSVDSVRSVSVMHPHGHQWTSPVSSSSVSDWVSSVQSTAAQIMETALQEAPSAGSGSRQRRNVRSLSDLADKAKVTQKRDSHTQRHSPATAEFLQKTLKRRLPSCSSDPTSSIANVRIHTLSCRLEMFVEEKLWKSLDRNSQILLNSVVMELEEWLHKRIQEWNRQRMIKFGQDLLSGLKQKLGTDYHSPVSNRSSERSSSTATNFYDSMTLSDMASGKALSTTPRNDIHQEDFAAIIEQVPAMPKDSDPLAFGVVKTSIAASSIQPLSQLDIPWPFYLINTRDCFTYDLIQICMGGREFIKTEFYFREDHVPEDYDVQRNTCSENFSVEDASPSVQKVEDDESWMEIEGYPSSPPSGAVAVGVTTYTGLFNHQDLNGIEQSADEVHENAQIGMYPPECYHPTIGKNGALKRTKYFFGARYLWTKEQLADKDASIAKGVRVDVPPNPIWMKELVERPLIESGIVSDGFINSWALNMYHDGSEGIQSHFDDSQRFCQPIYSLRLFSDSRLSFGTQLYGFTNGAFYIPMPRGCITIMHDKSYAANAIKHCVRPCDMTGKSAGLIMRKINAQAWNEAVKYHIDGTIDWLDDFHIDDTATKYHTGSARREQRSRIRPGSRSALKAEQQLKSDVKSVLDGLLRSVARNANQEEISEKRLRRIEKRVSRQIMESLIKSIEGTEKQAQREKKRMEKTIAPWKRKRSDTLVTTNPKTKRERRFEEAKSSLMNKSVILAANKIIERVMGKQDSQILQSVSAILRQYGPTWIQEQRQFDTGTESVKTPDTNILSTTILPSEIQVTTTQLSTLRDGLTDLSEETSGSAVLNDNTISQDIDIKIEQQGDDGEFGNATSNASVDAKAEACDLNGEIESSRGSVVLIKDRSSCSMNEDDEERRKLVGGLLDMFFKNVAHFVPEWQAGQSLFSKHASTGLVESILRQVSEEIESTDVMSATALISGKSDEFAQKESNKRTYKLVSSDICFHCEQPGRFPQSPTTEGNAALDELWSCQGTCRRSFHVRCAQAEDEKCMNCATGCHVCHACGEGANHLGPVSKCSLGICGKYYHVSCVMNIPETNVLQGNWMPVGNSVGDVSSLKFRCPQHYCKTCGVSGANVFSVTCIRCPTAYHSRCRPDNCVLLSKKLILCPKHKCRDG